MAKCLEICEMLYIASKTLPPVEYERIHAKLVSANAELVDALGKAFNCTSIAPDELIDSNPGTFWASTPDQSPPKLMHGFDSAGDWHKDAPT